VFTTVGHWTLSSAKWIWSTSSHTIRFNIILHLHLGLRRSFLPSGFPTPVSHALPTCNSTTDPPPDESYRNVSKDSQLLNLILNQNKQAKGSYPWNSSYDTFFLFLTEQHAMKAYWGNGSIVPLILDLGSRWRWVVSFTHQPLYSQGKSPRYPLDRRLGGCQSRSEHEGEEKPSQPLLGLKPQSSSP
jgi:hypothetical protein